MCRYVKLQRLVKQFCTVISKLEPTDPLRQELTQQMLEKLYVFNFHFIYYTNYVHVWRIKLAIILTQTQIQHWFD